MLKALEIVGFKSFADKTRLEFHRGITVVVGPNGSGKSNVVDAVKWVLGEQSVKSLRGKEMADVIFNGSGSRPPLNAAETTLTFDNSGKLLPIDTPEVHVTRRVYRNGEGEYLINRQPCRLRDIRDLLAGTGVGSEGYSVIEQGKVDALLQTSTRERRVIFEEAAGISRFRAKKVESLRRLERVDQNLLRLNDIVEEVDSRLRSVRNQAGKARRYREHAGRLQELRTQVGLADWRKLSSQLAEQESIIQAQRDEADVQAAKIEALEAESLALDDALVSLDEAVRTCEAQLARDREQISSAETTVEHERSRCGDLEVEIARHRHQYAAIKARSGDLDQQIATTQSAVAAAEQQHQSITGELAAGELSVSDLTSQMRALRQENEERRTACLEEMRTGAMLGNEISGLEAQLSALSATRQRVQQRLEELAQSRWTLAAELQALERNHASLAEMAARRQDEVLQAQHDLAEKRQTHSARTQDMSRLRQRLAGQQERIAVLDELEQRLEGHTAGVKEAIGRARGETPGPYRQVVGLVAELLRVDLELAPLIEALLGETAGHVVISPGEELLSHLLSEEGRPPGRLGLVGWDGAEPAETSERPIHFQGREGVVGPAEQFVQVEPAYEGLKRRLLGDAWVVDTLSRARQLAAEAPSARFITLSGELLGTDRTIILNARQSGAGFISRRSELRVLRGQTDAIQADIRQLGEVLTQLDQQIEQAEANVTHRLEQHRLAADAASEQRLRVKASAERLEQLDQQRGAFEAELNAAEAQHVLAAEQIESSRELSAQVTARLTQHEIIAAETARRLDELEQARQQAIRQATTWQVDLAKSEERLEGLRQRLVQIDRQRRDRDQAMSDHQHQTAETAERLRKAERAILEMESQLAELYWRKDGLLLEAAAGAGQRDEIRQRRGALAGQVQAAREEAEKAREKMHRAELAAGEVRLQRGGLAARLRDDYQIELAQLEHQPTAEELYQREEVDREIADLRRKINSIGAVNLDALDELDDLESRFAKLSAQYQDLTSAKASLQQIIGRINADSRRLFIETLDAVRLHFQTLFRKLFGGGQADIKLEEGVDPLDAGIEIIARPPGKDLPNISLYSGGERTLTSVALLLAIFANRPSPFCVLDEVDANLDEANIERFTNVLKDFLTTTQFIIVTHSKKTMTCANTLYGVTMQESGVSKPVSVRFEDVSETGEVRWQPDAEPKSDGTQAA